MSNTLKLGNGKWATGKDTVLGYNSENNNIKPLAFSFSRDTSGTVVNKAGLIETVGVGEPRIDFKDNTKGALLLEPSRSNLITYSEDFSNSYWSPNSNALRSLSSNLSPDGTANAYRVEAVTGTQVGHVGTTTIGTTITHSIWVRRISGSTTFNMVDVNNIKTSVNITSDWQRFSITSTATSTNLRSYFKTTALGDVVEIYGAQLEQGSYATSYIPTSGSAVTRNQDFSLQGGFQSKNIFGSNQGTAVFDIKWDEINYIFDFADAGGTKIRIYNDNNTQWRIRDMVGASWYFTGFNITQGQRTKIGFKWSGTEIIAFQNGVKSSINGTLGSNVSVESITTNKLNNISNMQFYNTALTDQELIALTS